MGVKAAGMLGGLGFSVLAALVRVFGGVISKRFGGERVAVASFLAVLVGALLLTVVTQFAVNLAGELVIALGMGIGNAAVFKMVPKYVPHAVGGASGWVGGLGALSGFVIPPILGKFCRCPRADRLRARILRVRGAGAGRDRTCDWIRARRQASATSRCCALNPMTGYKKQI